MPKFPFPFHPIRESLYSPDELVAGFDPARPSSYAETRDFRIYQQYVAAGRTAPSDYFPAMMQSLHDNSITLATHEFLASSAAKAVGIMGGHDLDRDSLAYQKVARLAHALARQGFTLLSGGGPGAMEATHLGALLQHESEESLETALAELAAQPRLPENLTNVIDQEGCLDETLVEKAHAWMLPAWRILKRVHRPGESLAIPTWLYGHEPTSPLATHIAKYFQNSIREEGLLAVASHGVIYAEGRAGTLQEIFQDANQNFYRLFGHFSPMTFYGCDYWTKQIPAVPVLRALFPPEDFARYVLVTDDPGEIVGFLLRHREMDTPSERLGRYIEKKEAGRS
jgi:predicted Rossmann-fold nucleotide-binding protein